MVVLATTAQGTRLPRRRQRRFSPVPPREPRLLGPIRRAAKQGHPLRHSTATCLQPRPPKPGRQSPAAASPVIHRARLRRRSRRLLASLSQESVRERRGAGAEDTVPLLCPSKNCDQLVISRKRRAGGRERPGERLKQRFHRRGRGGGETTYSAWSGDSSNAATDTVEMLESGGEGGERGRAAVLRRGQ